MGFIEVLTIMLVLCKIIGIINCPWLIILLPEILAVIVYLITLIITFISFKRF